MSTPTTSSSERALVVLLRWSAGLCLVGWAWVHLYWEGPYGILLWNEQLFAWMERRGIDWESFVGTGANDGWVQRILYGLGWIYLAGAVAAWRARQGQWAWSSLLIIVTGLLSILAYAKYLAAQRQLPMLIEYGGQVLSPMVLLFAVWFGVRHRATISLAMVAVIATFLGHGFYALGWWPTPGNFFGMISLTLGVDAAAAQWILWLAGALDLAVCVGLFVSDWRRISALYAVIWGVLTALARPVAGMSWDLNYWGADHFLHETAVRAPHFLIPLYLHMVWRKRDREESESPSKA